MIREVAEDVAIGLDREDLVCALVMHHRNPEGQARVGFFCATRWRDEPVNPQAEQGLRTGVASS